MESDSIMLRVHVNFKKRVDNFIKEYEKKNSLRISVSSATKLIDKKIEEAGGLII